jgi:hypothetical protein
MKNLHNKILHAIQYTELNMDFTSRAPQESSQQSFVHMIPQKKKNDNGEQLHLPEPMQNAVKRRPVEAITRRMSAAKSSKGTANGSKYPFTMAYAGACDAIRPTLLATNPTNVLTKAPLSALPHFVCSDL